MSTDHKDEEAIFYAALKLKSQAERDAYVNAACGNDIDLLNRIEALLKAHDAKDSFLEAPAVELDVTLDTPPSIEGPGTRIGRYELLELIGEGGMGLVYLAEQKEPVKRRVALKIIKPGMDSKQVVARFEAERQVLALLDHPNIAHVLDAGTTATGRPYFVMEYVKGLSITQYCDQNKVNIEQRLKLFRQVCEGVHHAHQKGIIHRDLKPSNILVSVHEDRVVPKIIDFGIAKATTQALTDKTVFTYQGQLLGTPEYMSPEQVDLATQDIDIRSDIYSLGVVLYELLAGVLPFERESLARLGFAEVQRTIREQEPASPSTRLSNLGEQAKAIAESRHTQVVPLARRLHRELEWIPLKAMRKDRCRRYRSAAELADDVQNYLDGNPLTAGPETAVYRVKKFMRRHAGSVATAALIAVTIILGLVVSTAMYWRSERALQREATARAQAEQATQKEATARTEAEQAKEKETVARTQAEQAEATTKQKAEELRRTLYVNSIQLADAKHREGNAKQARSLLDSCPEDLRGWEWNRLNYIQDESLMTLRTQYNGLWRADASSDGRRIVTCGYDEKTTPIKVWDLETGQQLMTLRGHEDVIYSLAISTDGRHIASGSNDKTIKLWDAQTGAELMTLRGHRAPIWALAFSPDGKQIVSGSDDGMKLWDVQTGAEAVTFRGPREGILSVSFSPDGKRIISGHWPPNTIRIWNAATGAELLTLRGHETQVYSVTFGPDGKRMASGGLDGKVKVWDASTGKELMTVSQHSGYNRSIYTLAFSPDGELIASGGSDSIVRIWDAETGKELRTFRGHDWSVELVAFTPDSNRLISASWDDTVKVWDLMIDRESTKIHGHRRVARSIAFSPDGKQIVSSSWDSTIKLWGAQTGEAVRTMHGRGRIPSGIAFSPDGRLIASAEGEHRAIRIWDALTGNQLMALRGHRGAVRCAAFSPDGKHIVSGSDDKTIKLWDAANGTELATFLGHEDGVVSVAFSPDGKRLVSGSWDKTIKIWDWAGRAELRTLKGHESEVLSVVFSPDCKRIASGSDDRTAKIWDAATGAELMTLRGHRDVVCSVAFNPGGERLVTGGKDGTANLWDATTGVELLALHADSSIFDVAFSPDGKTVAAGTGGGDLMLWESTGPAGGYELRRNAETARRLVEKLYSKCESYRDVVSHLQNDGTFDLEVRRLAIQMANSRKWEDAETLRREVLSLVASPANDIEAYRAALAKAEKANDWEPNDPAVLNTLGGAQYRLDSYEDAFKTLVRSAKILSDAGEEPDPWNLAFKVMTLHKIGQVEEAKAALEQLRGLSKDEQFAEDMEIQGLLAEAEGLIEGKKTN